MRGTCPKLWILCNTIVIYCILLVLFGRILCQYYILYSCGSNVVLLVNPGEAVLHLVSTTHIIGDSGDFISDAPECNN